MGAFESPTLDSSIYSPNPSLSLQPMQLTATSIQSLCISFSTPRIPSISYPALANISSSPNLSYPSMHLCSSLATNFIWDSHFLSFSLAAYSTPSPTHPASSSTHYLLIISYSQLAVFPQQLLMQTTISTQSTHSPLTYPLAYLLTYSFSF